MKYAALTINWSPRKTWQWQGLNSSHRQGCPGMTMLMDKSIIHSPEPVLCAFVHQELNAPKKGSSFPTSTHTLTR